MKRTILSSYTLYIIGAWICVCMLTACIDEDQKSDTPQGNLEALWTIMDQHYCFFDEKGINWDSVHTVYAKQMNSSMTDQQQFEVMANMLSSLKDGHVNLYTSFNAGRYWSWKEDYPTNLSDTLLRRYLKTDYLIASGMDYTILDDNIGYLRCETFQYSMSASNLDQIMLYLTGCRALIIDIRSNGGGDLTSAEELAARFTNSEVLVGYMRHKSGKGHNDFSDLEEQTLKPAKGIRWQKPVAVLTNRGVYSAANEFAKYMKALPGVTLIGDKTGGGAGMPFSAELPNGWGVRFSACPMYDKDKVNTEFGIEPHYNVSLSQDDFLKGRDTIIEFARNLLINGK